MTTVSVVIPAYNAAKWIASTLDSVLAQDFQDFEVIVVNDGSTDLTASILANYTRINCLHKTNGGLGSARNAGIRAAQGEYIAFVDADDLWLPSKLTLQVQLLEQTQLAWAYCDGYIFDSDTGTVSSVFGRTRRFHSGDILCQLFIENFIPSPTPLIRRNVFDEVGLFDQTEVVHMREDWDLWLRIAARYPVALVNRPLVCYRRHAGSNTAREHPLAVLRSQVAVIENAAAREPRRLGPLKDRALARHYFDTARTLASQGNWATARGMFAQAIRLQPLQVAPYVYALGYRIGGQPLRLAARLRRWWKRRDLPPGPNQR